MSKSGWISCSALLRHLGKLVVCHLGFSGELAIAAEPEPAPVEVALSNALNTIEGAKREIACTADRQTFWQIAKVQERKLEHLAGQASEIFGRDFREVLSPQIDLVTCKGHLHPASIRVRKSFSMQLKQASDELKFAKSLFGKAERPSPSGEGNRVAVVGGAHKARGSAQPLSRLFLISPLPSRFASHLPRWGSF